jgi:drug/metabolite transporter (DMT)-like permease
LIAHPTWLFPQHEIDTAEIIANATVPLMDDDAIGDANLAVAVTTAGAAMAGLAYVSVRLIANTSANVMVLYYATLSIPICLFGSYYLLQTWTVWGDGSFTTLDYVLLILTGLAGYGGQFFTNLGLQRETAATGTLATSTQIVWTYVFELLFLHEGVNGWSLGGTSLILGFMMVVGISKLWESSQAPVTQSASETAPLLLSPSSAEQSA